MTKRLLPLLSVLLLALFGCGKSNFDTISNARGPSPDPITISPNTATVGSGDLQLTITGSNFQDSEHNSSWVVWSINGSPTLLATTFVSSTQLKAVVSANLLISPDTAKVFVQTGDPMGDQPLHTSASADFRVKSLAAGAPTITAISPENARVGSSDLTISITGSNFENYKSVAFWATNPNNLHDTGTMLNTTFVSSTQIMAVIPASLFVNQASVQIVVLTGDSMGMSDGFFGYPESNSVTFTVLP